MGRNSRKRREARRTAVPAWTETPFIARPPLRRAYEGALGGAFMGLFFLAFGALSILAALASGRRISFDEFVWPLFCYLGAFVLAGAVMGLLWPLARTDLRRYAVAVVGAGLALLVMMSGFFGLVTIWDGSHWGAWVVCTLGFGAGLGRRLVKW